MSDIAIAAPMGRKRKWVEDAVARFPEGTFARINAVLGKTEDRTDFIREAVERELVRRELEAKRLSKKRR
jgi:hypothetical protein